MATLVNEVKNAGSYTVEFNGSNLPSGTYFCVIANRAGTLRTKLLVLR